MFERFTDRARRAVVLAQSEARLLLHGYIGTEHILLGLIEEGGGVAWQALNALGLELDAVRTAVRDIVPPGDTAPTGHVPFTPRAKKVLEMALREALQLGHDYIGTEHILLGLLREGEGVGAQVLLKMGVTLGVARQEVVGLLAGMAERSGEETPEGAPSFSRLRRGGRREREASAAFGPRTRRGPEDPERGPRCPRCEAELAESARVRTQEVQGQDGGESRLVAFVFCAECGGVVGVDLLQD
jgi:ATP-dependent Clp protease ATP-binding subunit ClpC